MNEKRGNKKGVSNIVVIAVVAILVIAVALGAYLFLRGGDDDKYADPLIQGKWGVGTTFTYKMESGEYNGESLDIDDITVTIVGQSGSYYMLDMGFYSYDGSWYYGSTLVMIHKTTGELRFADNKGKDSATYNGSAHSLEKWELMTYKYTKGTSNSESIVRISSDPNDGIPYRINMTSKSSDSESMDVYFILSSMSTVDPEPYVKSDTVGTGLNYSVTGTDEGAKMSGTYEFLIAAEGTQNGEKVYFLYMSMVVSGGYDGVNLGYSSINDISDASDFVLFMFGSSISNMTHTEAKISTIDGNVLCDKYVSESQYINVTIYVGQDNGVLYLYEAESDYYDETAIMTLKGYIKG